jgi:uncharacterized OB-fold protein
MTTNSRCERCGHRIHTSEPWCPRDCTPHVVARDDLRYLGSIMGFMFTLTVCVLGAVQAVSW